MGANRGIKRVTVGLVVLVLAVCAFVLLRPDLWRYYTDGYKIRQPGKECPSGKRAWERNRGYRWG